ncbi:MAG TPA: ATP-binding protein [Bryobacteraceae bacterium]|nr:ATP-binding protein [Bryobacteraceae bacterium]
MPSTEESLRSAPESGPAPPQPPPATISIDPLSGFIQAVSPEAEAMLGFARGTLAGKHISCLRSGAQEDPADAAARFISDAAHDLVAPLNQASALAGLLLRKLPADLSPDIGPFVQQIEAAAARMTALVQGIRKYTAVLNSECRLKPVDLNVILEATVASLRKRIEDTGAEVRWERLPSVMGDANLLAALLSALIDNAIKFARDGIAPSIRITARQVSGAYILSVADNGIGIPPERRGELFRPFRKLHGQQYPGTGLGLAAAKSIVEKHGGSIAVQAGEAHGTVLSFTLPAAE